MATRLPRVTPREAKAAANREDRSANCLVGQAAMRAIRTEMFEADPIRRARGHSVADRTADIEVLRNVPDEIPDKLS